MIRKDKIERDRGESIPEWEKKFVRVFYLLQETATVAATAANNNIKWVHF